MHWPDIFFKGRKTSAVPELPPTIKQPPENAKPGSIPPDAPAIKPIPVRLEIDAAKIPDEPVKIPSIRTASPETSTRTLPAMHGVVLRPPASVAKPPPMPAATSAASQGPAAPIKSMEQLMAEADPMRALSQSGGVHLTKRSALDPEPANRGGSMPGENQANSPAANASSSLSHPEPVASPDPIPPGPSPFDAAMPETKKPESASDSPAPAASVPDPLREDYDSPFILKPAPAAPSTSSTPPAVAPLMPFGSIFRRRAKMTDLARIVLPPKREESEPAPPPSDTSPAVVPPAFPVVAMTARASKTGEISEFKKAPVVPGEKTAAEEKPPETKPTISDSSSAPFIRSETPSAEIVSGVHPEASHRPDPAPEPAAPEKSDSIAPGPPKVDSEAHKSAPSNLSSPQVDPEAHKPETPAAPAPRELAAAPSVKEKREFHMANGERIAGVVLSETPEAVYVEHATLGVVTIPRAQIAKRLVEIILINGDRIVGDIMAETADTLYVRHASLGMLTVPRAQRSTRVVEAILKDGDRILGEVLTETDTYTVIRSAILGTVTVPHEKLSMLNRKIEQIELKALPPSAPELKDKPADQ
jgi:RNase P/RNase MRP subunit p29